jgi:hypothetical protein
MSDTGEQEGREQPTPEAEQDSAATAAEKGVVDKAAGAGQKALNDLGDTVDGLVADAPDLWDKTKKAAGGVADEVREKGPGIWGQMKGLASDAAARFDEAFKSGSGDEQKPEQTEAEEPAADDAEREDDST